jgi:uncharacterized membrane protein (DUF4010 family)
MDPAIQKLFEQLAIATALGLLVGLQRQHAAAPLAGLRTFPLVSALGALTAVLDRELGGHGWIVGAALLAIVLVATVGTWINARHDPDDRGITTEVAILLMFALGAYVIVGHPVVAIAIGAGMAALLHFKPELHGIAARLGGDDLRAIMQFALITFIVLPILPTSLPGETFRNPPLNVLNPKEIWLMVVLIVGISLGGYIVYKFFGQSAGVVLGGILGGAISSTATTMSYARRAAGSPNVAAPAAMAIMIASTMMYARVLIEISVVSPTFFQHAAPPIAIAGAAGALASLLLWLTVRREKEQMPEQSNPTELRPAIMFAIMYAGVVLALSAARHYSEYIGLGGLYAIAVLSGLTDMDAITLSTARLVQSGGDQAGGLSTTTGWKMIMVASMASLVFKLGLVAVIGNRRLLVYTALVFAIPMAASAALLVFWRT